MKRTAFFKLLLFFILHSSLLASAVAQTIGEAFYIYRNDGQINGFLRSEIDSIVYSCYDVDSVLYEDIVTQVIVTEDSIYKIPLAVIDSVGFVTPKTECKPGVIDLSEKLMPYITSCDALTIIFNSSTPSDLLPKVGDKLMTLDMNDIFPAGFAGEVIEISGDKVVCKRVPLEDIFETYYDVSSAYGYIEDSDGDVKTYQLDPVYKSWAKDFKFNTFTIPYTAELSRNVKPNSGLALKGGDGFSVEIKPSFHVRATLIISREEGTYFSASVTGEANIKEKLSLYGGLEWSHDFFDNAKIEEPIAPFVNFLFNPGLFLRASVTASFSAVFEQDYTFGWGRDWSSKGRNVLKPSNGGRLKSWDFDVEGCVDGSISAGAYVEIGVALLHSELDKLVFRGELGGEFASHVVLYNSDVANASAETKAYERFKQSSFDVNVFVSTSLQAQLAGGLWEGGVSLPWNLSYQLKTWDVVPTFSNTVFKQSLSPRTSADARADMSGDCLFPVSVGLSVRDKDGKEVDGHFATEKFTNGNRYLPHTFTNLSQDADYTLYPKVKLLDFELLANPSAELERTKFPVEISDFKVTKSQYKQGGFSNDGLSYDYHFDVSVKATLEADDLSQVADWGYVYLDPNGREKEISLRSFGTSYTDTRYAYFRNAAHSTCTLYGYVKYVGSDETVYGEPHDYELDYKGDNLCPDDHHPHMIDLGIGTLWSCCNVGASTPEGYGNYYAWGETSPKSVYNWDTYAYGSSWDNVVNIGSDISGTSYDAARANWSAPWRMPTLAECQVLHNCTSEWTTLNGVYGRKFTGPNGGSIFLPAAGYRWDGGLYDAGSSGLFWSSTLYESRPGVAYVFNFFSGSTGWGRSYSDYGLSVRPVR